MVKKKKKKPQKLLFGAEGKDRGWYRNSTS